MGTLTSGWALMAKGLVAWHQPAAAMPHSKSTNTAFAFIGELLHARISGMRMPGLVSRSMGLSGLQPSIAGIHQHITPRA
jgi:hypothetical protein